MQFSFSFTLKFTPGLIWLLGLLVFKQLQFNEVAALSTTSHSTLPQIANTFHFTACSQCRLGFSTVLHEPPSTSQFPTFVSSQQPLVHTGVSFFT